jgi:uncharacterized Zn finger protein (UPF0148 family)
MLTFDEHRDRACDEHAHCPFCGGLMAYDNTGQVVCQDCGTDALSADEPTEVAL